MCISSGTAFAHHEAIGITPNDTPFYTEGQKITTSLVISTGYAGVDHRFTFQNTTTYFVSFQDTSFEYGRSLPASNRTLLIDDMTVIRHNYTRLLPAGTWTTTVEVRDGNAQGRVLYNDVINVLVKGAEFGIIERQAEAAARSAQVAQENLDKSPIITATAALVGAGVAAGGTFAVHAWLDRRREERERNSENEFNRNVHTLIQLELTAYRDFINKILEGNVTKGERQEVVVIPYSSELRELADRILPLEGRIANPRNYLGLSPDTKARAFRPEQIRILEDLYGELHNFGTRNRSPRGSDYEFDKNVITTLRDRINTAIDNVESSDSKSGENESAIDSFGEHYVQTSERLFQLDLAKVQIAQGSTQGFGIALVAATIGLVGTMATLEKYEQLGNLAFLLSISMALGLALLFVGGSYGRWRLDFLSGKTNPRKMGKFWAFLDRITKHDGRV